MSVVFRTSTADLKTLCLLRHPCGQIGPQFVAQRLCLPVRAAYDDRIAGRDDAAVLEHRLMDRPTRAAKTAEARRDMDEIGKIALAQIAYVEVANHSALVRRTVGQGVDLPVQHDAAERKNTRLNTRS